MPLAASSCLRALPTFSKLRNHTVDFARHPLSAVFAVRDDGVLLCFTFMDEQKVYAWSRIITDGIIESVCSIREGKEDAVYIKVKRTIGGSTVRYTERFSSRYFDDVVDSFFVDSGLSYDGRNTGATTMTISGGTTWFLPEVLTVTASASTFKATDVGDSIVFWVGDQRYELAIQAYSSSTVVTAIPNKTIPVAYRSAAFTSWEFARDTFRPLDHLEGKVVAILADGNVVEDPVYTTVTNGAITLPSPASVVHIGLPYTATIETLSISRPLGEMKDKPISVPRLHISLHNSRAIEYSVDGYTFMDEPSRNVTTGYDRPEPADTRVATVNAQSSWSRTGRISIRQPRPLPMHVTGINAEVVPGEQ